MQHTQSSRIDSSSTLVLPMVVVLAPRIIALAPSAAAAVALAHGGAIQAADALDNAHPRQLTQIPRPHLKLLETSVPRCAGNLMARSRRRTIRPRVPTRPHPHRPIKLAGRSSCLLEQADLVREQRPQALLDGRVVDVICRRLVVVNRVRPARHNDLSRRRRGQRSTSSLRARRPGGVRSDLPLADHHLEPGVDVLRPAGRGSGGAADLGTNLCKGKRAIPIVIVMEVNGERISATVCARGDPRL